jgi:hypothetical protein
VIRSCCLGAEPFEQVIPPGDYPIILTVAHFLAASDQRVAMATIQVSNEAPVTWQMATLAGQEIRVLKDDQFYGYGVDSGCGYLMAWEAAQFLSQKYDADEEYADRVINQMRQTYVHTWEWAKLELNTAGGLNAAVFSSGLGDGTYASYFGYNPLGQVVCLITDFGLLVR